MFSLPIDLRAVINDTGGCVDVDSDVHFDALVVGEERFDAVAPAHVIATVSNVGSGFAAMGTVTAPVRATCSRCLCDFDTVLEGELEGLYLLPGQEADEAEMAEVVSADGFIDLGGAIGAALTIAAPFVPLHDEQCAGLCPGCGADLNAEECSCGEHVDDAHPFAGLASLLESVDDSEQS